MRALETTPDQPPRRIRVRRSSSLDAPAKHVVHVNISRSRLVFQHCGSGRIVGCPSALMYDSFLKLFSPCPRVRCLRHYPDTWSHVNRWVVQGTTFACAVFLIPTPRPHPCVTDLLRCFIHATRRHTSICFLPQSTAVMTGEWPRNSSGNNTVPGQY
jgi:hypothetical protein